MSHSAPVLSRYLSRHVFLSPTVQYVTLKAVQSVSESDGPNEEPHGIVPKSVKMVLSSG